MAQEEQSSFMDSGISPSVLTIKDQNCIVSLDSSKYPDPLPILIECLKASSLSTALTGFSNVSISSLTKAYSTAKFNTVKNIVEFEMENGIQTAISQTSFVKIMILSSDKNLIDLDLISGFKKNKLPTMWSCLFTILFKCLAERQTATDLASKQFLTLLHGLFTDEPIDFGKVLWTQFCDSPTLSIKDTEISMAKFWSLEVAHANSHYKIVTEELTDANTAKFPELQIGKLVIKVDICEFVGKVPEVMLQKVDNDNPILKAYLEANPLPHPVREIPNELNQLIEKQKSSKPALHDEDSETESDPNIQKPQVDDDATILFATKKDVKNVNRKLNKIEATSTSKLTDNSSTIKEFLKQSKEQMDAFHKTILDHVHDNANNFASQLNQFKMSQQGENKLHQMIGNLDNKNAKLKEDLVVLDLRMHAKDEEIAQLNVQNLDLNKRLLSIAEAKEHPLLQRIEQMLDAKMEGLSSSIQDRLLGKCTKPQATGPSSQPKATERTSIGVSQEILVSSKAEAHQHLSSQGKRSFASSSSKVDLSNVASALYLPLIVTNKEKQVMTNEESELSELQKLQQEI
ncbi:hypothetical protein LXL04_007860 [Taraxacum kok-saghyz]